MPVNPFDSFQTWRESADPTVSNSLAYFTEGGVHLLAGFNGVRESEWPIRTRHEAA